jgi:hypothetical protein
MKTKHLLSIIIVINLLFSLPTIGLAEPLNSNLPGMVGRSLSQQGVVFSRPSGVSVSNFSNQGLNLPGSSAHSTHQPTTPANHSRDFSHKRPTFSRPNGDSAHKRKTPSHSELTPSYQDRDRRVFDRHERSTIIVYNDYPYYPYYYGSEPTDYAALAVPTCNTASLSIVDIVNMVSQGIPDDEIINAITTTDSVFHLTSEAITYLKENGVSDRVIDFMLATGNV